MSINAYRKTMAQTESPRQIERRLLSEATKQMRECIAFDMLQDSEGKLEMLANGLRDAIWRNQQIWQALKVDLMSSDNSLSPALRGTLISLALWVERHSFAVLEGKQKVKPLIEVNLSIIRGLNGDSSQETR